MVVFSFKDLRLIWRVLSHRREKTFKLLAKTIFARSLFIDLLNLHYFPDYLITNSEGATVAFSSGL
jgi:hypothetical protein